MTLGDLFNLLDLDGDGALSRWDLHRAARRLRWHWADAPLYAVLDHLTIRAPLSEEDFLSCMEQIAGDFYGPYGEVLRRSALFAPEASAVDIEPETLDHGRGVADSESLGEEDISAGPGPLLARLAGAEVARDYDALLDGLDSPRPEIPMREAALLLIDPQRSFTSGSWKKSAGAGADDDVAPIRYAFSRCGDLLRQRRGRIETMFTRCPFPPDSYDWDERVADLVPATQLYFVKPGNSALWPPTNGYRHWLKDLAKRGKGFLVIGGCTLNSCVRVSAIETQQLASRHGLQTVVDLSLCGARTGNFVRSAMFGGLSSVESAVRDMAAAGVLVARRVAWV